MWYAVQVKTGEEEKTKLICNKLISGDILKECFIPYYERTKKYKGSWHQLVEILFPGYVFMISDRKDDLLVKSKKIPGLIKILGDGNEVIPLNDREIDFLVQFGEENHIIKFSKGYLENEIIRITEGPMKNFTGRIKKIDRHKRTAVIEMDFFGRLTNIHVGIEIIDKA